MNFTHYDLGNLDKGRMVEIILQGNAANVQLLDSSNFNNYRNGRQYRYIGGLAKKSPIRLQTTHSGHWHVAIDLRGMDSRYVQELILFENRKSKNVFCDWINDADYLKRKLVCKATLKVIETRLEQSDAIIFVDSHNSRNSIWCKYELNYFSELNRTIYCITIEDIKSQNWDALYNMKDKWFYDPDYKKYSLF